MTYNWINDNVRTFLSRGYLKHNQTVEERIDQIANHAEAILKISGFADRFKGYMEKGYYSLSSPIWSNFGTDYGLPISCFGSYVPDSMDGIFSASHEVAMMSKYGGGTSSYWGDVRGRMEPITNNGYSEGAVNFMRLFDTTIDVSKQGSTRRGVHAVYLPIDHKDIEEFLNIRSDGNAIQNLFNGVTVTDGWLNDMIAGDTDKRRVWAKVLESRSKFGTPYIFFTDNANYSAPDVYKDYKQPILASNVCTEIMLPQTEEESFVCDLSSLNLVHYDEWKDNAEVYDTLVYFLDAVMTDFIRKAEQIPGFERAVRFAKRHRALGIGVVGHFSYLQSKMIPFESELARNLNVEIYKNIQENTHYASEKLAALYGEPEVLEGKGRRNTTLTAIAPTTSSSFILGGVSQSIEPPRSNYYVKDLAKVKVVEKNKYLEQYLESVNMNTEDVWKSIMQNNGSVQHLNIDPQVKEVFKTFEEISQYEIISQAAMRQWYIDQGQSLNIMIHPDTPVKDLNNLHIEAWKMGIKSLYYQHSMNAAQEYRRDLVACSACEA